MKELGAAVATAIVVAGALVSGIVAHDAPAAMSGTPRSVLNGVYRVQYTEKELIALGTSVAYAKQNYGVVTMWLKDGRYRLLWTPSQSGECRGPYIVSGKSLVIDENVRNCEGALRAMWSLGKGELHLHVTFATDPGDAELFGSKGWKKIG